MEIIRDHLPAIDPAARRIVLAVERQTLAKRRWRGIAEDGCEFGFDLAHPLFDGDAFFRGAAGVYVLEQKAEPVLEVFVAANPLQAAQLGWTIGNLHFPLSLAGSVIRVPDDPALRQLFEREHISFTPCEAVFRPIASAHSH